MIRAAGPRLRRVYDDHEVRRRLRVLCQRAGSQRACAAWYGIPATVISTVLRGAAPSARILAIVGLDRVTRYVDRERGGWQE